MMDSTQPMHETMSIADDQERLLSSTNADELLMSDEKQWCSPGLETGGQLKRNRFMIAFGSYRWLIDVFLLFVITGLLLLLRNQSKEIPSSSWQVGGHFTGAGPKCLFCTQCPPMAVYGTNIAQSQHRLWSSSRTCRTLLGICPSSLRTRLLIHGRSWCRVQFPVIPHAA